MWWTFHSKGGQKVDPPPGTGVTNGTAGTDNNPPAPGRNLAVTHTLLTVPSGRTGLLKSGTLFLSRTGEGRKPTVTEPG